ncbi:MAG: exodeoxyribonuclease III [Gammaproteobacteria bacterium]|nr:exodeoxyribonuclease III [Gammaproteobacteria bacterium]
MSAVSVATWNVNSLRARLEHVLRWCEESSPDILALQETKVENADFPAAELAAAGYQALYHGQKSYNGVALLARNEGTLLTTAIDDLEDPQCRVLGASYAGITVLNLYVPNGSEVGSDKYAYKLRWLDALIPYAARLNQQQPLVIVGDFNIAPEDRDVHDPAAWEGQVLVSAPERERLQALQALGFVDLFRCFDQPEKSYSWWDYRAMAFRRNRGLRIDLILANAAARAAAVSCEIDRAPRTWERPSDHTPVVARFEVQATG